MSFLTHAQPFDILYLLYDPAIAATGAVDALRAELLTHHSDLSVISRLLPIDDPRAYDPLYRHMRAVCKEALATHGTKAEYNIFLSPGTPQMHAIWVLLSKTIFPATPWQGSDQPGRPRAEVAWIPFHIDAELLDRARGDAIAEALMERVDGLVGTSEPFRKILTQARQAALSDYPVLLLGETGTGKEQLARFIHRNSPRSERPFVKANCGAIPRHLIESLLFGHLKGAFTGAIRDQKGLFEAAQGGTLFLDEIGEIPLDLQPRLLNVLQDKCFTRVGDIRVQSSDVRIIAATNRQLDKYVAAGSFREDLYYRLNVVPLTLPPLRERRADVPLLIDHFLERINKRRSEAGQPILRVTAGARDVIIAHDWMGNIRDLENHLNRLDATIIDGRATKEIIQGFLGGSQAVRAAAKSRGVVTIELELSDGYSSMMNDVERTILQRAREIAGTQEAAAQLLKMGTPQNFQYHWKKCHAPSS